jgi:hypothetical protein
MPGRGLGALASRSAARASDGPNGGTTCLASTVIATFSHFIGGVLIAEVEGQGWLA